MMGRAAAPCWRATRAFMFLTTLALIKACRLAASATASSDGRASSGSMVGSSAAGSSTAFSNSGASSFRTSRLSAVERRGGMKRGSGPRTCFATRTIDFIRSTSMSAMPASKAPAAAATTAPVLAWRTRSEYECQSEARRRSSTRKTGPQLAHAQLALQAGRRRRVLERQFLVWVDIMMRALGGERGLMKTGQDQLQLAGIGIDVADGENARNARFEFRRVDRDQILIEIDSPSGDRAELHGEPEERQHVVAGMVVSLTVLTTDREGRELAVLALDPRHLPQHEFHVARIDEFPHRVDRMGRRAERVPAVNQGDAVGDRVQVQGPVERGIAPAHDHHAPSLEMVHLAHGIEHALVFVGVEPWDRRPLRLERPPARRDKNGLGFDRLFVVGADAKQGPLGRAQNLHSFDHLGKMKLRTEWLDLLHEIIDKLLSVDHRKAWNVVDRLLRIELRALAARFRQDVDEVRLDVEQTEFEHRKQADGPGADDRDVGR